MLTVAVAGTLMAMAVPVAQDITKSTRINEAGRMIEREYQDARLRAVSTNRTLRVRMNCPATGYIRTVEVLGTAADSPVGRCSQSTYPFPPPDQDLMTRPNHDGPVRTLPHGATVTSVDVQFLPDGTAQLVSGGAAAPIAGTQTITVTRQGMSRRVTINGAGKVQYLVQ
jgi:Tfp pilus assembly protein FimT